MTIHIFQNTDKSITCKGCSSEIAALIEPQIERVGMPPWGAKMLTAHDFGYQWSRVDNKPAGLMGVIRLVSTCDNSKVIDKDLHNFIAICTQYRDLNTNESWGTRRDVAIFNELIRIGTEAYAEAG